MSPEHFERDDEGIHHEIGVDGAVEDVDGAVVGTGSEEGVRSVVVDRSDRSRLVTEINQGGKGRRIK